MTKLKICGLTTVENALEIAQMEVSAIGLNFYTSSKRYVHPDIAQKISQALPPFVSRVGVFVNHSQEEIRHILSEVELDILQFHGDEPAHFCECFNYPYIKAIGVDSVADIDLAAHNYKNAKALLLDTKHEHYGGTGKVFDWNLIEEVDMPIILAGGITPDNAQQAIELVKPYALDVASGVESKVVGIKDIIKVKKLLRVMYAN